MLFDPAPIILAALLGVVVGATLTRHFEARLKRLAARLEMLERAYREPVLSAPTPLQRRLRLVPKRDDA